MLDNDISKMVLSTHRHFSMKLMLITAQMSTAQMSTAPVQHFVTAAVAKNAIF